MMSTACCLAIAGLAFAGEVVPDLSLPINRDADRDDTIGLNDLTADLGNFGSPRNDLTGKGLTDMGDLSLVLVDFGMTGAGISKSCNRPGRCVV